MAVRDDSKIGIDTVMLSEPYLELSSTKGTATVGNGFWYGYLELRVFQRRAIQKTKKVNNANILYEQYSCGTLQLAAVHFKFQTLCSVIRISCSVDGRGQPQ